MSELAATVEQWEAAGVSRATLARLAKGEATNADYDAVHAATGVLRTRDENEDLQRRIKESLRVASQEHGKMRDAIQATGQKFLDQIAAAKLIVGARQAQVAAGREARKGGKLRNAIERRRAKKQLERKSRKRNR